MQSKFIINSSCWHKLASIPQIPRRMLFTKEFWTYGFHIYNYWFLYWPFYYKVKWSESYNGNKCFMFMWLSLIDEVWNFCLRKKSIMYKHVQKLKWSSRWYSEWKSGKQLLSFSFEPQNGRIAKPDWLGPLVLRIAVSPWR